MVQRAGGGVHKATPTLIRKRGFDKSIDAFLNKADLLSVSNIGQDFGEEPSFLKKRTIAKSEGGSAGAFNETDLFSAELSETDLDEEEVKQRFDLFRIRRKRLLRARDQPGRKALTLSPS